jgi:hypothetical protein
MEEKNFGAAIHERHNQEEIRDKQRRTARWGDVAENKKKGIREQ